MPNEKRYLKIDEVSEILNISKPFAYKLISRKTLKGVKIGEAVRIPVSELERYISQLEG